MTFWQGKRVLVTGCSGLIGRPLVRLLVEQGADPIGLDLVTDGALPVLIGDVTEIGVVRNAVARAEVVFHLAAVSNVERSRQFPLQTHRVNVLGTLNVLEACRENKVEAIVFASSNHVYGAHDFFPTKEWHPLLQLDTYSASKIAADYIARAYAHNYKLPVAVVRNTNCFGPDDPHFDHIIPSTILKLLAGEAPIITSDGKRKKAYLYVDDVAEAYMTIAEYVVTKGVIGEAFNVSSFSISVIELVRIISELMESTVEPVILGRPNDQSDEFLDTTKLREATGWEPRHSIDEGLSLTIQGFRKRQLQPQVGVR